MRRLDLAGLAVFPAPFPRLSRPASDIIGPARIILQDDGVAIPWCGLNRTAHAKDAYSDGVIGAISSPLRRTQTLFHPWQGSKYSFWYCSLAKLRDRRNSQNQIWSSATNRSGELWNRLFFARITDGSDAACRPFWIAQIAACVRLRTRILRRIAFR